MTLRGALGSEEPEPRLSLAKRLVTDVRPLRESPDFRRLWVSSAVSLTGSSISTFALSLQIYDLTRSSAAVGALGLVRGLPTIAFGLLGGSFADTMDRRRLVLATSSALAGISTVLAVQAFVNLRQLWVLYLLAAIQSIVGAVDGPARRTFIRKLLPTHRVGAGIALNQLTGQTSLLAGPALAGVITAAAGLRMCYLIDACSFAGALYGLARLPAMRLEGGVGRPGFTATRQGLRFVRDHAILTAVFLLDIDAMVLGMPVALFPAINVQHFGGAAQTLGLLTSAPAVGGLLGSFLSGPIGRVERRGRVVLLAVVVWGAAIAGFGFSRALWLALSLLTVAGAADTMSVMCRGIIVQLVTPEDYRGRVTAVDYVVGFGGPQLGNFKAGVVASLTSPAISATSGGIATVLGALTIRLAIPAVTRHNSRSAGDLPDKPTPPNV